MISIAFFLFIFFILVFIFRSVNCYLLNYLHLKSSWSPKCVKENQKKMQVSNDSELCVQNVDHHAPITSSGSGAAEILRQWRREKLLNRGTLWLRGIALLFSLISFILVAINKHGDWREFNKYNEYR